ncbi:hypothetical protein ACHAWO_004915 [Cyclotella atomus]|uniref:Uncharacterized protein n=1 Tax=Cyclotella atomus TaxID=382360 RepID=A0ABD3NQU0_9STRA
MRNFVAVLLIGFIGSVKCLESVDGNSTAKHLRVRQTKDEGTYELTRRDEDENERAWDLVFGKGPENMAFYKTKLGGKKTTNRTKSKNRRKKGSCPQCGRNNGKTGSKPSNKKPSSSKPVSVNKKPANSKPSNKKPSTSKPVSVNKKPTNTRKPTKKPSKRPAVSPTKINKSKPTQRPTKKKTPGSTNMKKPGSNGGKKNQGGNKQGAKSPPKKGAKNTGREGAAGRNTNASRPQISKKKTTGGS